MVRSQEQFSKATLATAASIERLQKKVDPAYRSLRELEVVQRKVALAIDAGTVSAERGATIIAGYEARHQRAAAAASSMGGALAGLNDNVRLTSNQMLNLSRQGTDVATMFALGAPPMQIFASQIGQIYGALEEGPGGLRGSLKAAGTGIAGFARSAVSALGPGGMIIAGVSAATAAAIYFTDKTQSNLQKIDKAAKSYAETLKIIERSQRGIGAGISSVVDEAQRRTSGELAITSAREIQTQREALRAARQNALSVEPTNLLTQFPNVIREASGQVAASTIAALGQEFYDASRPIVEIRTELEQILAGPGLPGYLRDAADEMLSLVNSGNDALAAIKGLEDGAAKFRNSMRTEQLSQSVSLLEGFIPDRMMNRERINNEAANATELARSYGAVLEIERKRALAIAEIDRQEGVVRQGRELDLRAIGARTVAEQALIASERERLALSGENLDQSERAARIAQQSAMIIAQANRSAEDTLRASRSQNASAGLQGYQASAQAIIDRYQIEIEQANGAAEAVARLTEARNLDLQTLQIQTQRSLFQPQMDRLASIEAEAAALGASDEARRRLIDSLKTENDIRQAGISATGEQAETYRRNAAALSDYEDRVRRSADAWGEVKRTGEDAIDGLVGSLTSGDFKGALKSMADDVAKTVLQLGVANPLKNALFGTSYGTLNDMLGGAGAAPKLGAAAVQATGSMQVTAAVVNIGGSGIGGAIGALNDNFKGGSAAAVSGPGGGALNFVGGYKQGVNAQLTDILKQAAQISGLKVDAISGYRPGDSRFHGKGLATDVRLYGQDGSAIPNYQNAAGFRAYEKFAQVARQVQMEKYPELNDKFRWGGYFGGAKGKYGALDSMHFDVGGSRGLGMSGGSWQGGLNQGQRKSVV